MWAMVNEVVRSPPHPGSSRDESVEAA